MHCTYWLFFEETSPKIEATDLDLLLVPAVALDLGRCVSVGLRSRCNGQVLLEVSCFLTIIIKNRFIEQPNNNKGTTLGCFFFCFLRYDEKPVSLKP